MRKPGKTLSAEQMARIAERNNNVSGFFTNTGKMMKTGSRQYRSLVIDVAEARLRQ
jgi:hypothetical protein